uniref:Uncharacterized protein n=1 Tax=Aureoumbra lagunensis TaxID=44058 RepID=A0A7S3JU66_9STRA|mmetsp:Transcript_17442/g.22712  ORF Transcript_17442/g.22712 Transcript_17442/m.22712 type:complete len:146 (+) Transcript_17442:111-548(+)|eukprot:CAMPEP_0197298448 /NCGR_PEP_ID=MMETSP0890-20130614/43558_1 /TAXON_ID=44058 ORGANISM="Aureoumbra lagunensis, Strain CCMP1510" /NCGR_SAMPLE_ID=MMETSP0890 /ASSEMBLY_ACC=CAM_ASM_000533 /LENGTH=145 /DNA_ID=CAMNT_0042776223 /DNA_START=88 /DNA_END=525 /DNA_ORIENTATION=-
MVESEIKKADQFIKSNDLAEKVKVLESLRSEEELEIFERDVRISHGSGDDMALIISFKDGGFLNKSDRASLKRSGSDIYWNRSQDHQCVSWDETGPQIGTISSEKDYWNQVLHTNNTIENIPQGIEVQEEQSGADNYWDAMVNYA